MTTVLSSVSSMSFIKLSRSDGVAATQEVIYMPFTASGVGTCVAWRRWMNEVVVVSEADIIRYLNLPNFGIPGKIPA